MNASRPTASRSLDAGVAAPASTRAGAREASEGEGTAGARRPGDRFEPRGVAASSRAVSFALVAALVASCGGDAGTGARADPGVEPGRPIAGLGDAERGRFLLGRALFERLATEEEGLGPLYNAERCSSCHDSPAVGGGGTGVPVLKATRFTDGGCDLLEAHGGDNIQRKSTRLALAHGVGPEWVPAEATDTVSVIAPPLYGLGLLEAVPDSTLERLADPDDGDADGISGRLPRLAGGRAARFGRKGDAATIAGFVDTALRFELGLTTPDHPAEETRNGAPPPPPADPMPDPEMDARGVGLLVDFVRYLGPPARQYATGATADTVARGEALFERIGCSRCHVPELRTGDSRSGVLVARSVRAYSDLLLHDLGRAEDGRGDVCGRDAAPGEYRTAPLWGLRYRGRYLHDGAAPDVTAAIALHGGEAAAARAAFAELDEAQQSALLRFLGSL